MNMFEEAETLAKMMKMCSLTQSELAKKLSVTQPYVANKLRLLKLDGEEREKILSARLTERHARALLRIRDRAARGEALDKTVARRLTVAEVEALADYIHADELPAGVASMPKSKRIAGFTSALSEHLDVLTSAGITAYKTVGYHGRKTYITIAIDEG